MYYNSSVAMKQHCLQSWPHPLIVFTHACNGRIKHTEPTCTSLSASLIGKVMGQKLDQTLLRPSYVCNNLVSTKETNNNVIIEPLSRCLKTHRWTLLYQLSYAMNLLAKEMGDRKDIVCLIIYSCTSHPQMHVQPY